MKNYFEHEIEVKYCDGLLEHKTNWQWFIDEVEKEFEGYNCNIKTWQDFIDSYCNIQNVYAHLIKINSIANVSYVFSKHWLEQINNIALLFNGNKSINEIWAFQDSDFIKLFTLIVFTTKLQNLNNNSQFLFTPQLYVQNNIFKLYDLSKIQENATLIFQYLDDIQLKDIEKLKNCLKNNLNNVTVPPNISFLENNRANLLSADAFNFQRITLPENATWEERFVLDMVQTSIENKEIVPFMVMRGIPTPDTTLWTEDILNNLNEYFSNEITSFIIETVNYILHKIKPSDKTIIWHFKLLIKKLKELDTEASLHDIECSSLKVIQYLIKDKLINNTIKTKFIKDFLKELQKFEEPQIISYLKHNDYILSSQQYQILNDYNSNIADSVHEITTAHQFIDYCDNEFVAEGINNFQLDKLYTIFYDLIDKEDSVVISFLFNSFMKLLLRLLRNINMDKAKIKNKLINLQLLWENQYFDKCVGLMHSYENSVTIPNEQIEKINELYFSSPVVIALYCLPISKEKILELMVMHSKNVISLSCHKMNITKFFPIEDDKKLERHNVDIIFTEIINNILKDKSYKLLNYVEPKILFQEIYNDYSYHVKFYMSFFNQIERLYLEIQDMLPEYELIKIENNKICLAHLVQLFPILENKIREYGMYFNIVPFKEKEDDFLHMKDASNVLQQILIDVYNETGDLLNVVDFFFIYQCMYNGNFLNIRNECVHGREYISGDSLSFGFKVTLLSIKLILNRLNLIKTSAKDNDN